MPARLSAFVIWALVAASAAFWGLRLVVSAPSAPAHTVAAADTAPARVDLTRLLGAPPSTEVAAAAMPAISSRFQLTGVMAPRVPGAQGIALIAVDGKMPRAYRVGSMIDGELVLQSVSLRSASIGPARGAPAVVLEVPPLPVAATGTLSAVAPMAPGGAAPMPPVAVPPTPVAPVSPAQVQTMPGARVAPSQRARGLGITPRDQNNPTPQE
ncbi:MAG TPA: type II secretion system protein N [Albitalea sp.]|nr:type II secretion system protein N [Albitalea sp.]